MERIINLRMTESDARTLMQLTNFLTQSRIETLYAETYESYMSNEMPLAFKRAYEGFSVQKANNLSKALFERLEEIFTPPDEVTVNLIEEEK